MLRRTYRIFAAALLLAASLPAFSQSGEFSSYSPYSIFGVGNLSQASSAYNASMAGVGIASRNHRYLNTLNPAAVAVRDSLAFMIDFSLFNNNSVFSQTYQGENYRSANNATNMAGMALSFPLWRNTAMMLGIRPYSSVGYNFAMKETDPAIIAKNGNISYSASGVGSLYDVSAGFGFNIGKRFSAGAQADYIFGKIQKTFLQDFSFSGYNEVEDLYTLTLNSFTGKFGVQYEQPVGRNSSITLGATYSLKSPVGGFNEYTRYSVGSVQNTVVLSYSDTLRNSSSKIYLAGELGVGLALNLGNRFRAEFDYLRSDWTVSGMDSANGFKVDDSPQVFKNGVRESYRLGFEFVPNINDVRYYSRRVAYRAGTYYNTEYYTVAGLPVKTVGITLGATLPVFRWYNGLTVTMDLGHRGPFNGELVKENYIKFGFGVNLFDIWFQKPRYN